MHNSNISHSANVPNVHIARRFFQTRLKGECVLKKAIALLTNRTSFVKASKQNGRYSNVLFTVNLARANARVGNVELPLDKDTEQNSKIPMCFRFRRTPSSGCMIRSPPTTQYNPQFCRAKP